MVIVQVGRIASMVSGRVSVLILKSTNMSIKITKEEPREVKYFIEAKSFAMSLTLAELTELYTELKKLIEKKV